MRKPAVLWHYTSLQKLVSILRDGMIKTTDALIDEKEKPAAWFSSNETWEESATKGLFKNGPGRIRIATRQEMIRLTGGLVRIGVRSNMPGLVDWREFKRVSGIRPRTAKALEESALYGCGFYHEWYAIFSPVGIWDWEVVQVLDGDDWIDLPENLRVQLMEGDHVS